MNSSEPSPASDPVVDDRDGITMRTLGRNGRFGNQLFQYMFLRTYAQQHNLRVETPRWIGQYLYGFDDPPISAHLPQVREKVEHGIADTIVPHAAKPFRNVDFWGYFQYHTSYYAPQREFVRRLFTPLPWVELACDELWGRLQQRGGDVVGIHLRRGDYVTLQQRRPDFRNPFYVAPSSWYTAWLREHWDRWSQPVVFLASDEPEAVAGDFVEFPCMTLADLGDLPQALPPYFLDFAILCRCRALAISNSTFSYLAAMLNDDVNCFVRPDQEQERMIVFDPWNATPLLRTEESNDTR